MVEAPVGDRARGDRAAARRGGRLRAHPAGRRDRAEHPRRPGGGRAGRRCRRPASSSPSFPRRPAAPTTRSPSRTRPPSAKAQEGSTVTLTVSLGLVVNVPDVVGEPENEAARRIEGEQLLADEHRALIANGAGRPGDLDRTGGGDGGRVQVDGEHGRLEGREHDRAARPDRPAAGGCRGADPPPRLDPERRHARRRRARRDRDRPGSGRRCRAASRRRGDDRRLERRRLGDRARRRRPVRGLGELEPLEPRALGRRGRAGDRRSEARTVGCSSRRRRRAAGCAAATR